MPSKIEQPCTFREMPRYRSHKIVHALKIASVELRDDGADVYPADEGYAPFEVSLDWATRYKPTGGDDGYYVVYDGGYASWSPTKAFRDGYTLIDRQGYAADENTKPAARPVATVNASYEETTDTETGRITRSRP